MVIDADPNSQTASIETQTDLAVRSIPNKFQLLIDARDKSLYTRKQRAERTVIISRDYLNNEFIPALLDGACEQVARRASAVHKRAEQKVKKGEYSGFGNDLQIASTVEALSDSHYRKQQHFGPMKREIAQKVCSAFGAHEPIQLVGLMFTRKNVCPLKRGDGDESVVDLAEIISFVHLNSFAELIGRFHPYGARFTVLSEGVRFLKAFDLCEPLVRLYQNRIRQWIETLGLQHMSLIDYEDFLNEHLSAEQQLQRQQEYKKARELYRSLMLPIFNPDNMEATLQQAVQLDPVTDPRNPRNNFVPLWDSIKNSLPYPELRRLSLVYNFQYDHLYREVFRSILQPHTDDEIEQVRKSILAKSWHSAIEHNARVMGDANAGVDVGNFISPYAFRTSINPKPGSHLGVYAVRETTSRVQPWHGTAYIETDGIGRFTTTVLSRLEIESKGGNPVCIDLPSEAVFFYANNKASEVLSNHQKPTFNMATRI